MIDLDIKVSGEGATRIVHLQGACDLASAPKLREVLSQLRPPDVTDVVLDLSALDFVDSTGLGMMLGALRRLRERGGTLKVAGAQGPVRRVLEVTDLDKVIPVFPDVASARVS